MSVEFMLRLVAGSLLLFFLAVPHGLCRSLVLRTGTSHGSVTVAGKKRTFRIHIPEGCDGRERVPLIIVLHGGVGCGWSAEWDSRMSAQSEMDHFIVAYPNGKGRTWNANGCCGPARKWKVDDVGFIRELINKMTVDLPVDVDRVYVTGISNGGMLAYRLGIELADQIAAIAPVEGCMYPSNVEAKPPVSVIAIHGTADKIIRFDGGIGSMFGYKVTSQSVQETIGFWVAHNQCSDHAIHEETTTIAKDTYPGGKDGTEVCLYTIKGGGHAWPGGRRCIFAGDRPSKNFSATEAITSFFLSHPKTR